MNFYQLTTTSRNSFLRAIRTRTTLPATIREVAIARVAVLNRAWYEWEHHAILIQFPTPEKTLQAQKYVFSAPPFTHPSSGSAQDNLGDGGLDEAHLAVLEFTDHSTLRVEVPDTVFQRVRKAGLNDREVVELIATVGGYNCVSRFLVALDVSERNGRDGMRESNAHVHKELVGLEPARRPDGL